MKLSRLIRTDLAVELRPSDDSGKDTRFSRAEEKGISYSAFRVFTEEGTRLTGKPIGTYLTLDTGSIWLDDSETLVSKTALFSRLLREIVAETVPDLSSVFVACLGNAALTADALGPHVWNQLHISRHLASSPFHALFGPHALSALAPGVTGQTGIETAVLIRHAVEEVQPSLIIAVDALAAMSPERLCTTVQLSNTGIAPGSGIGNHRSALNRETLGVPVIAIGVPTLVDSATLLADALRRLSVNPESHAAQALLDPDRHFFVTRKETDLAISLLSELIAAGINRLAQDETETRV